MLVEVKCKLTGIETAPYSSCFFLSLNHNRSKNKHRNHEKSQRKYSYKCVVKTLKV